ncbi:MAG: hypothetical protein ACRELX_08945, partial [Longimicrobiales bacterium]
ALERGCGGGGERSIWWIRGSRPGRARPLAVVRARLTVHPPQLVEVELGGAVIATVAGEAVGQDAAAEVGAEVVLDPAGYAVAVPAS